MLYVLCPAPHAQTDILASICLLQPRKNEGVTTMLTIAGLPPSLDCHALYVKSFFLPSCLNPVPQQISCNANRSTCTPANSNSLKFASCRLLLPMSSAYHVHAIFGRCLSSQGLMYARSYMLLYYRIDWFEELGVSVPNTWCAMPASSLVAHLQFTSYNALICACAGMDELIALARTMSGLEGFVSTEGVG
eukprot:1157223-Pelagomonas_calceolata.AAC.4